MIDRTMSFGVCVCVRATEVHAFHAHVRTVVCVYVFMHRRCVHADTPRILPLMELHRDSAHVCMYVYVCAGVL